MEKYCWKSIVWKSIVTFVLSVREILPPWNEKMSSSTLVMFSVYIKTDIHMYLLKDQYWI